MSCQTPEITKKKKVDTPNVGDVEGCDEPVTVVCSRYEREREPLSLIRTCQELAIFEISRWRYLVARGGGLEVDTIGSRRCENELDERSGSIIIG